jgi:hypothetical protein
MREQTAFDRIPNIAAEIHIKMDRAGQVYVSAPHAQRGSCYMLLELARDQIDKECDRLEKSPIVAATEFPALGRTG